MTERGGQHESLATSLANLLRDGQTSAFSTITFSERNNGILTDPDLAILGLFSPGAVFSFPLPCPSA